MGQYLTPDDVAQRFADPLSELASGFKDLCQRWAQAYKDDDISRPDLLLNDTLPEAAMGRLRKLLREASGKLEDAAAGVYRYRKVESQRGQTSVGKSKMGDETGVRKRRERRRSGQKSR